MVDSPRLHRLLVVGLVLAGAFLLGTTAAPGPSPVVVTGRPAAGVVPAPPRVAAAPVLRRATSEPPRDGPARRPSFVLVLMDDFSLDLLQTMRHARRMGREGAAYRHAYVVDSLCCVSRSSLLTGQYPHQTGVLVNTANLPNRHGPLGGWQAFDAYGNGERSVNVTLRAAGYTTGYVGKFLNGYEIGRDGGRPVLSGRPPGWSEWRPVFLDAYDGWGFHVAARDGSVDFLPVPPSEAPGPIKDLTSAGRVTSQIALDFIARHEHAGSPYFLEVGTYAPHVRMGGGAWPGEPLFPPEFADRPSADRPGGGCGRVRCRDLTVDDLVGYGDPRRDNRPRFADGTPAPAWRTNDVLLTERGAVAALRGRARMVQSVDRMLGRILRAVGPDTYVVLTSDNGYHLGQHRLEMGKGTPYDSDVHVPLLVTGPGVPAGPRLDMVSNIDLAPTIEDLAGVPTPRYRSGESFAASLRDPARAPRRLVFLEHTWAPSLGGPDPDRWYAGGTIDLVPSYVAVRSADALLVRVDLDDRWRRTRFAWEYYDYRDAPFERVNTVADPARAAAVASLRERLARFLACRAATRDDPVPRACRSLRRQPLQEPIAGD